MTQSLHGRQMTASLKLGEALGAIRDARMLVMLARQGVWGASAIDERLNKTEKYLNQALAAIEAAVKEG